MSFSVSRKLLISCCSLAFAATAQATIVPATVNLSATPAGSGLNGAYYNTTASLANNAAADAFIAGAAAPTATFHSTAPKYTAAGGSSVVDSTRLSSFLGSDAGSLSGSQNNTLDGSIFRFSGYLNVTRDMDTRAGGLIDVNFRVYSDDGMRLNIGGVTIDEYTTPRSWGYTDGSASFAAAGLYAIDLLYWENGGNTGINMQWQTGANTAWTTVAGVDLYSSLRSGTGAQGLSEASSVPEPASWALIAVGLLGLRRAGKRSALNTASA